MQQKKSALNYFLIVFILISVVCEVFILNIYSNTGDKLNLINRKIDETETGNNRISQKIASSSSMITIADKAKNYGLVNSSRVLSLTTSLPLAANFRLSL